MGEGPRGNLERLRGLLAVTRLVNSGVRGEALRTAVAETIARAFGFGTVVVNLRRPDGDGFEVVTVHGSDEARAALVGTKTGAESWRVLLDRRFEVAGAYFIPAGAVDWSRWDEPTYVPQLEPREERDGWLADDALFAPLRHSDGHLLGVLSVDEPENGLRPERSDLAMLASVAAHLAQALEAADANEARERLLREVRDAEQRYRSLVDRLPALVYRAEIGEEGQWFYVSPPVETILGFAPEEWLADQTLWIRRVHPDDRDRVLAASEQTRVTGEPMSREYRVFAKDGTEVWVRDEAVILEEAGGPIVQGVMYDITHQKRAEDAIRNHSEILERTVSERTQELEEARIETLQRLAFAAEYRDEETHLHTERVGWIAALLAETIGLPENRIAVIRQAAPLHDIGKLGVPDSILLRAGRLSRKERDLMRAHANIGAKILEGSHSIVLRTAEEIALTHHERWDGSGYPHRLKGERIPTNGRLVAIADVFDALTHTRPYKEAWPLDAAIAEILRLSGTHFDPRIVDAFESLDHRSLLGEPPRMAEVLTSGT